jgi:hypothetical protein
MSKQFTVDDIQEIKLIREMMGVEAVWCTILFKGCTNPVKFYATPHEGDSIHLGDAFQIEMYTRLKAGEFGLIEEGIGDVYTTIPPSLKHLEATALAKRNQLLLESDWTDTNSGQARLSDSEKTAWAAYRQALRDITSLQTWPTDITWPTSP